MLLLLLLLTMLLVLVVDVFLLKDDFKRLVLRVFQNVVANSDLCHRVNKPPP